MQIPLAPPPPLLLEFLATPREENTDICLEVDCKFGEGEVEVNDCKFGEGEVEVDDCKFGESEVEFEVFNINILKFLKNKT